MINYFKNFAGAIFLDLQLPGGLLTIVANGPKNALWTWSISRWHIDTPLVYIEWHPDKL